MHSRRGLFVVGGLALALLVSACASGPDTSTSPSASAAPSATADAKAKKTSAVSSDVLKKWQTDLTAVGCDPGPVDGIDGGETEAAIKAFQKTSKIAVDGRVGPQTETALSQAVASGKKGCTPAPSTGGGTTSSSSAAGAGKAEGAGTCPGPNCTTTFTISPSSGPAGATITVKTVSGPCTLLGQVSLNPTSPPGPAIAVKKLEADGANQYQATITVPAGKKAGSYVVQAWSTAAMQTAGVCQAGFTLT